MLRRGQARTSETVTKDKPTLAFKQLRPNGEWDYATQIGDYTGGGSSGAEWLRMMEQELGLDAKDSMRSAQKHYLKLQQIYDRKKSKLENYMNLA